MLPLLMIRRSTNRLINFIAQVSAADIPENSRSPCKQAPTVSHTVNGLQPVRTGQSPVSERQGGCGVVLVEEPADGERLSDSCGLLSASSPHPPRSVLGPRVPQVSLSDCVGVWGRGGGCLSSEVKSVFMEFGNVNMKLRCRMKETLKRVVVFQGVWSRPAGGRENCRYQMNKTAKPAGK